MKRLMEALAGIMRGLLGAVSRFPLTVLCLSCVAVLICYMISLHKEPDLVIQKLMFTFLLGSFLGVAAQFACERFEELARIRILVYSVAAFLIAGYYLILSPAPQISIEVTIRTVVAVFAMLCIYVWLPSFQGGFDFNKTVFIHFKSALTSVLYSGVLSAGCAAIIAAIDILLFNVDDNAYGYMMTIVWVLFATIYYLSLLPHFNSENDRQFAEEAAQCPRFLEILLSYIAIPLVAIYTLVLAAYFVKILVTLHWPSGQLGPMVLAYSAAGLVIYILCSRMENRFADRYRLIFPKALIPIVIMQFISVAIRLNAYGVTESRYYVVIFAVFSMICAIILSFQPAGRNGIIAVLAACIAILSVVPPVDAFTVSRISQINRLESMLVQEGILTDGKVTPKTNVPEKVRQESTSILTYLENRKYIKYVRWLPDDFKTYDGMENTLGFEPFYPGNESQNFYASMDMQKPFSVEGYDICVNTFLNSSADQANTTSYEFKIDDAIYRLDFKQMPSKEWYVAVNSGDGSELIGTGLDEFTKSLITMGNQPQESYAPDKMTFDVENNGYKLRIMFQSINVYADSGHTTMECSLLVMFGTP